MKIGDHVHTPHGTGHIIGFKPETDNEGFAKLHKHQLVVIEYDSPRRHRPGHWYSDKVRKLTVSEKRERENDPD